MDELIRKNETCSKGKKRLTQNQVRILESNFSFNNKLEPERRCQLAAELGVPPRQVSIWYQNKRARDKVQSLEIDHQSLQHQLESVLADNAMLKVQVERLKDELKRTQGGLMNSFNEVQTKHDLEEWFNDSSS